MLTKEEYEAKRLARYKRLLEKSQKTKEDAERLYEQARKMASIIPPGQPILIGHYSERADRRYRERIDNKREKGWLLYKQSHDLERQAEAALNNKSISSDDPSACEKLSRSIAQLEKYQELMKEANKLIKKGDTIEVRRALSELGLSDYKISKLFIPDFMGRIGFPKYLLANNSAEIRRLKARLTKQEAIQSASGQEEELIGDVKGDVKIVKNYDINRLQIFFPNKPNDLIRHQLKANGFHWSHSERAWQRMISNQAIYWAEKIIKGQL